MTKDDLNSVLRESWEITANHCYLLFLRTIAHGNQGYHCYLLFLRTRAGSRFSRTNWTIPGRATTCATIPSSPSSWKRGVENFPAACGLDWGALSSSKNESEWLYFHLPCCGAYYTLGQEYRDMNLSLPCSSIFLVYSQQNLSTTNWNYLFSILTNHMASWDENQSSASSCILLTLTAISSLKSLKKKSFSKNLVFFGAPWKISPCGETHSSTSCFRGCWIPHPLGLRFTHSGGSWFSISVAWNTYTSAL